MWSVWWLADQLQPAFGGFNLNPVALALVAKLLIGLFAMRIRTKAMLAEHDDVHFVVYFTWALVLVVIASACIPIVLQNAWIAQVGYTIGLATIGLGHYALACFSPEDIKAAMPNTEKSEDELAGLYSIAGLAWIGFALISTALIGRADDLIWVFTMSIGALIYNYMVRWVSVLWLLTRHKIPE